MSIAINSSPAGALGNPGSWKRKGSDDEDERQSNVKKYKSSWYVTLDSESPVPTDEDDESIHTIQGNETELATDTSDTSMHTSVTCSDIDDISSDMSVQIEEYDVDDMSDDVNLNSISSSSEPENILSVEIYTFLNSDSFKSDVMADNSGDSSSVESAIRRADFRICLQCKNANSNSQFRYCEKCYQKKKEYFPREKRRRKRRAPKSNSSKEISRISSTAQISTSQEFTDMDSGIGASSSQYEISSQDVTPDSQNSEPMLCDSKENEAMDSQKSDLSIATTVTIPSSSDELDSSQSIKERESDANFSSLDSVSNGRNLTKEKRAEIKRKAEYTLLSKKLQSASNSENSNPDSICNMCSENPKNGVFVHGKITHLCCCYKCAVKIWAMHDHRCPMCNRRANRVSKLFCG